MNLLQSGLRKTKGDKQYNGPPRRSGARFVSKASLTLETIHEQNRLNLQKRDNGKGSIKIPDPAPGPAAKGKPRLLLMGQRRLDIMFYKKRLKMLIDHRSGKSSISSVVFHKMPPNETLFLESTARIHKDSMQYDTHLRQGILN